MSIDELAVALKHLPGKHTQKKHGRQSGGMSSYGNNVHDKLESKILDYIKSSIDDGSAQDASHVYENSDGLIPYDTMSKLDNDSKLTTADRAQLEQLADRKSKDWEAAFKRKFGVNSYDYADEVKEKKLAKLSPIQRKVSKRVGGSMSMGELTPDEIKSMNVRYAVGGGKTKPHVTVASDYEIGARITAAHAGMPIDEFVTHMESLGITKAKRGKL